MLFHSWLIEMDHGTISFCDWFMIKFRLATNLIKSTETGYVTCGNHVLTVIYLLDRLKGGNSSVFTIMTTSRIAMSSSLNAFFSDFIKIPPGGGL